MAMMTVEAMEMAARSRSLRWPEKDWVMTVIENMASLLKMEGPAIAHNFFDSNHVCLSKLLAFNSSSWFCSEVDVNRGCCCSPLTPMLILVTKYLEPKFRSVKYCLLFVFVSNNYFPYCGLCGTVSCSRKGVILNYFRNIENDTFFFSPL